MTDTFSQLYVQIVFSVKDRKEAIKSEWEGELHKYITGIIQKRGNKLIAINGTSDHIHIFIGMTTESCLSDLVREIKKGSTAFIKSKNFLTGNFYWQEGYGAFSYSHSQIDKVVKYIQNQKEHHKKQTFQEEFKEFLEKFNVSYNEQYL